MLRLSSWMFRQATFLSGFGLILAIAMLTGASDSAAHGTSFIGTQTRSVCLGSYQQSGFVFFYSNLDSFDEDWDVSVKTGISSGDRYQDTRWYYHINQDGSPFVGALSGSSVRDWIGVSLYAYHDVLSYHIPSSMDLFVWIWNLDSVSQCYETQVDARAFER